jgi:CheY-like chemotaxis protein
VALTFKCRVLFVDDEASIRQTGRLVLEAQGYEVVVAENGLDALQCLSGPLPDLIITDLRMPQMSGFEFLAIVRRRFPQIPTIALSGEYVTSNVAEALLTDAFMQKGHYDLAEYLSTIKGLIGKTPHRPFPGTNSTCPIWVSLTGSGEVIVTCPRCLRSFAVDAVKEGVGLHRATCDFCHDTFTYHVDHINLQTALSSKPTSAKRARPLSAQRDAG